MISLDDFYLNWKILIEKRVVKLIQESLSSAMAYADSLLTSLYNDRGTWDASGNLFPNSGGSGPGGMIEKGDTWLIVEPGAPGSVALGEGDIVRAFVDNPGQTPFNWIVVKNHYGYIPFNKAGDTLTGTDGSGKLGLPSQTALPSNPLTGVTLFANTNGEFSLLKPNGTVINVESIFDILAANIEGVLVVDMQNADKVLTADESRNSCFILTNVGDGTKTLTLYDSVLNPALMTFYAYDNHLVHLSVSNNTLNTVIDSLTPLQVIYRPTVSLALNYVSYTQLMTPGWASKVHINKYGLVDQTSTLSTADVPDSLNKRYITEAEKAAIDNFIASGGDAVPPTRMINGHTLETDITLNKSDIGLTNVDNTSDLNKPISTATQTALNLKEDKANKGIADGYVPLDHTSKIALTYLPSAVLGGLKFKGFWNATTNRITSSDPTINNQPIPTASSSNDGWYFIVQVDGSTVIDGNMDWQQRDWIVSIGSSWQELDNTDAVWSVNGHEGIVTLQTNDIPDSIDHRYVTDAEKVKLSNLSGVNTGDKTLAELGGVPLTRTVNGHALSSDINIAPVDIGLGNVDNTADMDKPVSTYQAQALLLKQSTSQKGQANGYVPLDANSLIPSQFVPHDSSKQDTSEKGQPNGYAPLNSSGKVPNQYLPNNIGGGGTAGAVKYMGVWDADLNLITSDDVGLNGNPIPAADPQYEGYYFIVSYTGATDIDGIDYWNVTDWIVCTGASWVKVNNLPGVTSVNGRSGVNGQVTLTKADINLGNVNNTSDINKPVSTAQQTALNLKEDKANKGAINGYAPLDGSAKVPIVNLPSSLSRLKQTNYLVTSTDVSNKNFVLPDIPADPTKVDMVIYGGIHQKSTVDFIVTGNLVSWNSLALELLIEAGQNILLTYST